MATFRLVSSPNFAKLNKDLTKTAQNSLHDEIKRVRRERFSPIVANWSTPNRTTFKSEKFTPTNGARSTITAFDKEDGKPLFKWVHQTGTKPHVIRATKAHGLLVFQGRNNRTVFTRKPVNHPGFKSSGKYDAILREEPPKIIKRLEKDLERTFDQL